MTTIERHGDEINRLLMSIQTALVENHELDPDEAVRLLRTMEAVIWLPESAREAVEAYRQREPIYDDDEVLRFLRSLRNPNTLPIPF